jgi:hypothetical protein
MIQVKEYKPKQKYNIRKELESKRHSVQFLPESLYQESLHKNFTFNGKKLKTPYLIDIIHSLIIKYYFKKENLFNLSSLILKEKYGCLYNYYMDYLVSRDILKLVKKHQKGKNARIYKLNDGIINGKITRYKNEDYILLKKYKNTISLIESQDIDSNTINADVKRKLVDDLFHVEIQFDKAICFLDSTLQEVDIYNRNKYSVECINDRHIFYHFDNYGRMHTNFTILKSFIRKNCLLINGEETSEIDIKNSQPLFLCKLIESNPTSIVNKEEFELFKFLTFNGKFYQYLMNNSKFRDRKLVKEMIYKVFFGKNFKNKSDDLFKSLFPTIYEFITSYKKENGDYRILSHKLQNLESNLIFNKIVKEIMYVHPEINLVTVHDSIICNTRYREVVEKIFYKNLEVEFQKQK